MAVSERAGRRSSPAREPVRTEADDDGLRLGRSRARSIGRVHSWHGNALVLARALAYILANGGDGLRRVAERRRAQRQLAPPAAVAAATTCPSTVPACTRSCSRPPRSSRPTACKALDVAKRLLEEGFHAPTVYFPLIVEEALMIEPTETESPQTLEAWPRLRAHRRRGHGPAGASDGRIPQVDAGAPG